MNAPSFSPVFLAELEQLFTWRRDVRHFRTDPLPDHTLQHLLETACMAPSVGLSEPWRFVKVDSPTRRHAIRENFALSNARELAGRGGDDAQRYASLKLAGLDEAPHHIAVFCETHPQHGRCLGRGPTPQTTTWSPVMPTPTFRLAAPARGIGAAWVLTFHPGPASRGLGITPAWQSYA